jgi:hypothetical protein
MGKRSALPGNILNHPTSQAEAVLITHHDPNGNPYLERKEEAVSRLPVSIQGQELRCTIPPHSVVFITVRGK